MQKYLESKVEGHPDAQRPIPAPAENGATKDALRGIHHDRIVIDEASNVTQEEDWEAEFVGRFGYLSQRGEPSTGSVIVFIRSLIAQKQKEAAEAALATVEKFVCGGGYGCQGCCSRVEFAILSARSAEERFKG